MLINNINFRFLFLLFFYNASAAFISGIVNNGLQYIHINRNPLLFLTSTCACAQILKNIKYTNSALLKIKKLQAKKPVYVFFQKHRTTIFVLLLLGMINLNGNRFKQIKYLMVAGTSISIKEFVVELIFWNVMLFRLSGINRSKAIVRFSFEEKGPYDYDTNDIKQSIENLLFNVKYIIPLISIVFYVLKINECIKLIKSDPKIATPLYILLLIEKMIYFSKDNCNNSDVFEVDIKRENYNLDNDIIEKLAEEDIVFEKDSKEKILINYDQLSNKTKTQIENKSIESSDCKIEFAILMNNRIKIHLINMLYHKSSALDLNDRVYEQKAKDSFKKALFNYYTMMKYHAFCLGNNTLLEGHGHGQCCYGAFKNIPNHFSHDVNAPFTEFLALSQDADLYDVKNDIINYNNIFMDKKMSIFINIEEVNENKEKLTISKKVFNFLKYIENFLHENI